MNWKNEKDYEFTKSLTREGWAWEFLRRNEQYKSDFEKSCHSSSPIYVPQKSLTESEEQWIKRCIQSGLAPQRLHASIGMALNWGISKMMDPANNTPPKFRRSYPYAPTFDDLQELYVNEELDHAPVTMREDIAVIAFDLKKPLSAQFTQAKKICEKHQSKIANKPKNWKPDVWRIYIRLLDAKSEGAKTSEIIEHIVSYQEFNNQVESGYAADKRVSENTKTAIELQLNPLQILL